MALDLSGPADTSMMRIVHEAVRRDLARAQSVLTDVPYPDRAQRAALSAHLHWMIGFLHHHHESEDNFLYPMVRAANPTAASLLDDMDSEHQAIQPALTAVEDAVARYALTPEAREELVAAIDSLHQVLLPHLLREEKDMMPVVSAAITEQQWRDWDQTQNVKPLTLSEQAFTGNWIIDDLSANDEAIVAALVPPIPRWLIRHVLVRGYRKAMFACWQLPQHTGLKIKLSDSISEYVDAPPDVVWRIVTDVTRTGEWSHECHTVAWTDGSTHAAVGARFRGRSRSGRASWSRLCTVHLCAAPTEFAYCTQGRLLNDSTEWHWTLTPEGTGTRIVQRYRVRSLPLWADRLLWWVTPAHHDRRPALVTDLKRLAALAESEAPSVVPDRFELPTSSL